MATPFSTPTTRSAAPRAMTDGRMLCSSAADLITDLAEALDAVGHATAASPATAGREAGP